MSGLEPVLLAAAIGGTALQYMATVDAGKAEKGLMEARAREAEIQGRREAINYKEKGIEDLKQLNKTMATLNARAGSGNMNPYSTGDTTDILMGYSLREAVNDFTVARDNATISTQMGQFQAANYRVAGENALRTAKKSAMAGVFTNVATVGLTYGPSAAPSLFPNMSKTTTTSDIRAKENIKKVGVHHETGLNLYMFNYIWDKTKYIGVIAQEVLEKFPKAVDHSDHFLAVDYNVLGLEFKKVV